MPLGSRTSEACGTVPGFVIGGAMCVPLVNRGQLLGVLTVLAPDGGDFEDEDLDILSLFAEPVAAAIAKAGLYEAERANVAKLLESDRMKSQFVASVSHELRTPITSIRGAVAASRRTDVPSQREELLEVVDRQSGRLQAMVEEMLVAARMQENAYRPTIQHIDLCALIRLTALDSHVAGRSVELELPEHCMVRAEPEALRRVLTNLIENAHKYGSTPIRVAVQVADDQVVLSVIDCGPGIPPEERERIFERFYRVDPTARSPAWASDSRSCADSSSRAAARCGSRTHRAVAQHSACRCVRTRCPSNDRRWCMSERPKVLIVDDEPDVLLTLRMILESEGFDPLLAADGETALRHVDEERPDLVVLDIMMPVLDGWFGARRARRARHASVGGGVLGEVGRQRPRAAQELGADEYVTKPFEPDDLVLVIRDVLSRAAAEVA